MKENEINDQAVLTCWKDIARYLDKSVRTVQRWEQEFGLPVLRPDGVDHKSAVMARPRDLDAWLESRWTDRNGRNRHHCESIEPSERTRQLIREARELRQAH